MTINRIYNHVAVNNCAGNDQRMDVPVGHAVDMTMSIDNDKSVDVPVNHSPNQPVSQPE